MSSVISSGMSVVVAEQGLWYGRLCTTSSSTIILYDHLITFGDEVRLIWRSRWSAGKALFLISRYYNIFTVIFNSCILYSPSLTARLCFAWLRWQAVSGIFVYGLTEIILMLRLYAMYSSSKRISAVLVSGFSAVLLAEIVVLVLSTKAQIGPVNADPSRILDMSTCILTNTWRFSYLYWIPFLVFEFLLFVLALAKGIQSIRDHELELGASGFGLGLCCKSKGPGRAAKALEILIRDSILYFVVIFAIYLANALSWIIENGRIGEIPVALAVALSTVMAQRLLLNIRENFERRQAGIDADASTAAASDTFALSTMAFDGLCVVSDSGAGAINGNAQLEHNAHSGRVGQITSAGSTFSGSTIVAPSSPLEKRNFQEHTNAAHSGNVDPGPSKSCSCTKDDPEQ
ncbi:uncharacterized protein FOMMEDRAFT_169776 [Fomitiporia mediterranea MF3/22]|uniref:uncharacterized protein n=1 Tax=Fomitiporia mediterranea (strain MF3/22) TaxID=694068 RepID=UPI00044090E2|nr:uncharacterized protein FOMMEDRAFT_169776 [Fomitiporia mediterranea MF3/22]EJD01714.1 hypothetical protein FOMMEDRAFT_169776 [Fomitiporia mediterranea MF3/22]